MRIKHYSFIPDKEISLETDMEDVLTDFVGEKGGPDWDGWDAFLASKAGKAWVRDMAFQAVDVCTNHMEYGMEQMKK